MELRQLKYFVTVAETKSLTAAVDTLFIAQPALSQSIKLLEEELGSKLFHRSRKGMELTNTGKAFLQYANSILRQVVKAKESILDAELNPSGSVSIAMPPSVSHILSAPLFKAVKEQYPNIVLNLEEGLTFDVRKAFDAGLFDMLVYFHLDGMENISIEPLIEEDLYLATFYDKDKLLPQEIDFTQMSGRSIVFPRLQYGVNRVLRTLADKHDVDVNILSSTAGIHTIISLIELGVSDSVVPATMIQRAIKNKTVSAARIVNPCVSRTVNLIVPSNRPRSNASNAVMKVVRETIQRLHESNEWPGKIMMDQDVAS